MRNELYDFANQLNNMFYRNGGYKSFPIDCVALDGEYKVYADLPGIKKEDINIQFEDSTLTIEAKPKKENKDIKYLIRERNDLKLKRSIYFNDIEEDGIKASLEDGILCVAIKLKKPEKTKKTIEIE